MITVIILWNGNEKLLNDSLTSVENNDYRGDVSVVLLSTVEEANKKKGYKVIHDPSEIKNVSDEVIVLFSNGVVLSKNVFSKLIDALDHDNNAGTCLKKPMKKSFMNYMKYSYANLMKPAENADLLFFSKKDYFEYEDSWGRTLGKLVNNAMSEKKFSVIKSFIRV